MDTLTRVLIVTAEALLAAWGAVAAALGTALGWVDTLLAPILAPLLALLNPICTAIGDAVYAVVGPLPAWAGLTVLSIAAGVIMLIAFRYTSNQKAIARAKDEIKANILALKLFKDDLGVMFRCQVRLFWCILRLQRYVLTPVLIMLLPMLLGLAQMGLRHQWRPLRPGEPTLIRLTTADASESPAAISIEPNPGLVIEVGPVPGDGQLVWRVRGGEPGRHTLRFHVGDNNIEDSIIEKELVVGDTFQRVSPIRASTHWTTQLLYPAERRLPANAEVASIEIVYPALDSIVYGSDFWMLTFFVISMAAALILKPVFKVRF